MKTFQEYLDSLGEYGVVTEVNHPLVVAEGLPSVKPDELILFEDGAVGQVFSMNETTTTILSFSKKPSLTGTKLTRTGEIITIPVGESLLGKAINPLGELLNKDYSPITSKEFRPLHTEPPGISARAKIKQPLHTGTSIVDMLIPMGKGQRELIIGDRKSGKTSFLLDTLTQQIEQGTIVIYAAIGKKRSDLKDLESVLFKKMHANNVVLVATSSYDSPSLIFLTPYAAMTIAEYFKDQGKDTLVIFDDLSTHAKFYREISLVAKNFPGRDSYPGDIFYTHAKLLERAGNFLVKGKEVAISCLPVVETIEGDVTGYIVTNIMSMTDGHIFFDTNILYQGRRPAINSTLSVTRVGKQVHSDLERSLNRELLALLTLYEKTQNISHFGAEMNEQMKQVMEGGEKFYRFFTQSPGELLPQEVQLLMLAMLWIDVIKPEDIENYRAKLLAKREQQETRDVIKSVITAKTFTELLKNVDSRKEELQKLCA